MLAGPKFGERLTRAELFGDAIVVMIGQNSREHINDRGVSFVAVEPDMPARRDHGAAEAQLAILDAVDLLGEIDAREHVFAEGVVIGRGSLPAEKEAGRQESETGKTRC